MQARLTGTGLGSTDERDTTCCYARQDKFWVDDTPDGERWEVYTVLDDAGPATEVACADVSPCCA